MSKVSTSPFPVSAKPPADLSKIVKGTIDSVIGESSRTDKFVSNLMASGLQNTVNEGNIAYAVSQISVHLNRPSLGAVYLKRRELLEALEKALRSVYG